MVFLFMVLFIYFFLQRARIFVSIFEILLRNLPKYTYMTVGEIFVLILLYLCAIGNAIDLIPTPSPEIGE